MTERLLDLVVPLVHETTAMRTTETAGRAPEWSGAVSPLGNRPGDIDSTAGRSTLPIRTMPGTRISTTATRTTTTATTSSALVSSADQAQGSTLTAELLFTDLVQAYLDCRQHKRNTASAIGFEIHLERNLCELYDELVDGSYTPWQSICFVVTRPKPREVWAADFRDRIVHHLLYNHIGPRFEASFIADSCACIKGRGTLYAARRVEAKVRSITQNWSRPAWYLKLDLANFFVSIDKTILRQLIADKAPEPWWRNLAETILMHDPRQNVDVRGNPADLAKVPVHKRLMNQDARHGLPIGNLSSQFFANVLLNPLDQHIKHHLRIRHYARYVDDMVLLHESPQALNAAKADIEAWLPTLGLSLNPRKTILQPVDRGIDFVGHVIKPWHRTTRKKTVKAAYARLYQIDSEDLYETANSYFGLLRQATHSHHDRTRLANILRQRDHCINGDITQTYRRSKGI